MKIVQRCNIELKTYLTQCFQDGDRINELGSVADNLNKIEEKRSKVLDWMKTLLDADIGDGLQGTIIITMLTILFTSNTSIFV